MGRKVVIHFLHQAIQKSHGCSIPAAAVLAISGHSQFKMRPQKLSQNVLLFYLNTDYTDFTDRLLRENFFLISVLSVLSVFVKNISLVICGFI